MGSWATIGPAVTAAFLASLVEVVEAFTIVLAVATIRGWQPAALGTISGFALLIAIVLMFGPVLDQTPVHLLRFIIGVLLLLFGLRWLRKAILRAASVIPMHDEQAIFTTETAQLQSAALQRGNHLDWLAGLTAFKAVTLEGLEVVFIVVAVGAKSGLLVPASIGALAACILVLLIGIILQKPLSTVPENTLKFAVGVMLSAFGVFWTGEGLGIDWPGHDLAVLVFALIFLTVALGLIETTKPSAGERSE